MAYQPKSYKKFVATAATATLVVSAVAPVASAAKPAAEFSDVAPQYKEAVDYLVDNTIAAGKTPSTFGTAENIIRVDAAIWIAKATLTEGEISAAPASNFTDVPDRGVIYVDALKSKGYVNGTSATAFNAYANISRGEVALILAEAYGITGNTANNKFTDVNSRYLAAVSALKDNGITAGKTSTSFGTGDAITRGELAIWVHRLETLGEVSVANVNVAVDGSKATVTADVKNAEASATATVSIYPNGDLSATPIVNTATVVNGKVTSAFNVVPAGTHTVVVKVGEVSSSKSFTIAATSTPKVESVTAINGKEIQVTFNTAIDAKTLKNASNQEVITLVASPGAKIDGTVTQQLSADGKVLTLKTTSFFKGEYTVQVPFETVKGLNGEFVSPVNYKVTVGDNVAPVLTSAKSTVKDAKDNIKLVTLTFNEEVSSIDNVKIGGVNYSASLVGKNATVAVDLDGTKSYDVTVVNAKDAAGNVKDVQVSPLIVTVDNIAPSISKVEATGENTLKVTVDEALLNDTLVISGKVGTFTANVVESAVVNSTNNKEYTVTLDSSYLFKNGNSDNVTLTVAKGDLADTLGNANTTAITKTVVVSKDATGPSLVQVNTTANANGKVTAFTVTYNEEVATPDLSKVSVVNSKGEILPLANVVSSVDVSTVDPEKVVFTLNTAATADKYGFDFAEGFVVDTALTPNKSAKNAFTVDVNDATVPVTNNFTIAGATASNNVITVNFGTKVKATGTGSALNPASYQVNGTVLPSNTLIAFVKDASGVVDQTKVTITLPANFIKANDEKAILRVTGVQNLDNKVNNSFIAQVPVTDNTAPVAISIAATDLTKLTVTYSEAVALPVGADVKDEIQLFNSTGASVAITGSTVVDGKLVLTVANAAAVTKLTTTASVAPATADIVDLAGVAQKTGVTVNK